MPVTTYSNQTANTSGTSQNTTFGDKYTKTIMPLVYAAGGFDPKWAKKQAKYQTKLAKLGYKLGQGKMDQAKYDAQIAKLSQKYESPLGMNLGQAGLQGMLEENPMEFYPGNTYVQQDPYTLQSIAARAQAAQNPAISNAMQQYIGDVLGGRYMAETNPYLQGMYQDAASGVTSNYLQSVLPQLEARFANAGGRGGAYLNALNASNQGLADELAGMAQNLYGTAYMQERDLMQKAAGLAPEAQQLSYYNLDELRRAGAEKEDFARIQLQDLMDRFAFNQNRGYNELQRMMGAGSGLPMAAGSGQTQYTQRTIGSGSQQAPSPPDQMPMWAQFLGSIL